MVYFKEIPYKGKTEIALCNEINKYGQKILKKTGDENLDDLIRKLLQKDPTKRITWEEYFNHPFFDINLNETNQENNKELVPFRPEVINITSQRIKLLIPPISGPSHPRTVYFIYDPKINNNLPQNNIKTVEIDIIEKKFMFLYKAYKNLPLCLSEPLKYNKIIRSKLYDNTNIIWKLMKKDKMFPFLKTLNKYQKYNHFPMTWELTKKYNLYKNYIKMKKKFQNEYNYMSETYLLPKDYNNFVNQRLNNFDLNNKQNLWILKPYASSKGRGIELLTNINDLPKRILATHYIYNPHLINGKKYDLRLYLLVTGYCPVKIYLFDEGTARFCNEKYDLNPENLSNKNIHLTDYPNDEDLTNSIQNNENNKKLKWSLYELKKYFNENKLNFNIIWSKIKDIIIKLILSVTDKAIPLIKSFKLSSCNLFELYGVDILLDEMLNPWLLEVNLNPSLNCDNQLELRIKSKLITDILNIIGAIPFSHDGKFIPLDKPNEYKDEIEEGVIESLCEFERPVGGFERIFPLKDNIKYYSQFLDKPGDENSALWKQIMNIK